jgi:ferredoxin-nitrite reductase
LFPLRRQEAVLQPILSSSSSALESSQASQELRPAIPLNAIEGYKASMDGNGLRIRESLPEIIERGAPALTLAEKELLKWVGVFFRRPTPGKFMMRVRMPNGFVTSAQLRAVADLSRRLGNSVLDITTRQQLELRGFTLDSVPAIWEKLRGVDLRSLQTGIDNIRNINGCALAGLTPNELFDASPVVQELDRLFVGADGNPEFANLPRKLNITITACLDNCTHNESQDIALVPARKGGRLGFNVLVGGKMGSGGFTIASPLNVFVEIFQAARVVAELVKIYRDHGPREARSKCRFAFLIEQWGIKRLRSELVARLGCELEFRGKDMRGAVHADHLGVSTQQQKERVAVGICIPIGRINPSQVDELARLADEYGNGEIRLTIGQNAIIPNVATSRVDDLLAEPLLKEFSPRPSPFLRGLVACVGTDYCNLALIETKSRAVALSQALKEKLGSHVNPLTIHWSGCPAGCGNHQAADVGLRGFKTKIDGKIVDAVAIYTGGRTGPNAIAGREILETVACDDKLPEVVAEIIQSQRYRRETSADWALSNALPAVATWIPRETISSAASTPSE